MGEIGRGAPQKLKMSSKARNGILEYPRTNFEIWPKKIFKGPAGGPTDRHDMPNCLHDTPLNKPKTGAKAVRR